MRLMAVLILALAACNVAVAADPPKRHIDLNTERIGVRGIQLADSDKPVFRVILNGSVSPQGEGNGSLILDLTEPPTYDEFGFIVAAAPILELKLDCKLKFVRSTTRVYTTRVGGPGSDKYEEQREDWSLYAITGPKIKTKLFLALPAEMRWPRGRLLIHGPDEKVKYSLDLLLPPQPEPCHPGCFPAGTPIRTPNGVTPIELVCAGNTVTTVSAEGQSGTSKVENVFITRNRLLEVRTAAGNLVTTETQPLALKQGGFRAAGELKAGDEIWRWFGNERRATAILGVAPTGQEAQVFNLVLGAPTTFIAGDFLARSKPPVDLARP